MRHWLAWLALLGAACTPRGSSQPPAHEPAQAPDTTAVVNVPAADAGAPATGASAGDAALASATEAEQPDSSPDVSIDGGVGVSGSGTLHGSGDAGDSSVTFSNGALSPDLVVRSALLVPSTVPSATFGNYELLLFDGQADCNHRQGHHFAMSTAWKGPTKWNFTSMTIANGHVERYVGHIEVLRAPTAPGSTGAIRLDPAPGDNVRGGRVPVEVCP